MGLPVYVDFKQQMFEQFHGNFIWRSEFLPEILIHNSLVTNFISILTIFFFLFLNCVPISILACGLSFSSAAYLLQFHRYSALKISNFCYYMNLSVYILAVADTKHLKFLILNFFWVQKHLRFFRLISSLVMQMLPNSLHLRKLSRFYKIFSIFL